MKNIIRHIAIAIAAVMVSATAVAQQDSESGIKIRGRVGYSLGATTPMGIPEEVREIKSYNPKANISVGVDIQKNLSSRWGVMAGVHFENKGMKADVDIKAYDMKELRQGDQTLAGYFTGGVVIDVTQWMLTIPVMASFDFRKVQVHAGPYLSVLVNHDFSGYAYDGYLRQDTPTGAKVEMGHQPEDRGNYDLSENLRDQQFGIMAGADWQFARHLGAYIDLSWGLTGIFKSDFKTIEQTLYPIFGTIGVCYKF